MYSYENIINESIFANGLSCGQNIRFFITSVTTGANVPVGIKGKVILQNSGFLGQPMCFEEIHGIRADAAFLENAYPTS